MNARCTAPPDRHGTRAAGRVLGLIAAAGTSERRCAAAALVAADRPAALLSGLGPAATLVPPSPRAPTTGGTHRGRRQGHSRHGDRLPAFPHRRARPGPAALPAGRTACDDLGYGAGLWWGAMATPDLRTPGSPVITGKRRTAYSSGRIRSEVMAAFRRASFDGAMAALPPRGLDTSASEACRTGGLGGGRVSEPVQREAVLQERRDASRWSSEALIAGRPSLSVAASPPSPSRQPRASIAEPGWHAPQRGVEQICWATPPPAVRARRHPVRDRLTRAGRLPRAGVERFADQAQPRGPQVHRLAPGRTEEPGAGRNPTALDLGSPTARWPRQNHQVARQHTARAPPPSAGLHRGNRGVCRAPDKDVSTPRFGPVTPRRVRIAAGGEHVR